MDILKAENGRIELLYAAELVVFSWRYFWLHLAYLISWWTCRGWALESSGVQKVRIAFEHTSIGLTMSKRAVQSTKSGSRI